MDHENTGKRTCVALSDCVGVTWPSGCVSYVIESLLCTNHKSEVSFWYNCSRSLKFIICGPDRKICSHIENGLFP